MLGLINTAVRKIRAILGLGASGAVLGLLAGMPVGLVLGALPTWLGFMTFFGAVTGAGFGVILAVTDLQRSLAELRTRQMALFGGAVGHSSRHSGPSSTASSWGWPRCSARHSPRRWSSWPSGRSGSRSRGAKERAARSFRDGLIGRQTVTK
jgi:uncharacterized membrane protein